MTIFLESNQLNAGYISLKVLPESGKSIHEILNKLDLNKLIPIEELHMTLMYDKANPNIPKYMPSKKIYNAKVTDLELMGHEGDKWSAIALVVSCKEISKRFDNLIKLGFKHSYDDFIPHISIKYQYSEADKLKLMANKKYIIESLPEIKLGIESIEPIDE